MIKLPKEKQEDIDSVYSKGYNQCLKDIKDLNRESIKSLMCTGLETFKTAIGEREPLLQIEFNSNIKEFILNRHYKYEPETGSFSYCRKGEINEEELTNVPSKLFNQFVKAVIVASHYHQNQFDKAGKCYFSHPCRVSKDVTCRGFTIEEVVKTMTVAILHDTLEDTELTKEELIELNFDMDVIDAVELLTKKDGIPYMEYVKPIKDNKLAREVKLSDLRDNMNEDRLPQITEKDKERLKKYQVAYSYLLS